MNRQRRGLRPGSLAVGEAVTDAVVRIVEMKAAAAAVACIVEMEAVAVACIVETKAAAAARIVEMKVGIAAVLGPAKAVVSKVES
jgi:hypothetical protein